MAKEKLSSEKLREGGKGFALGLEVLRAHLKTMPKNPGVYRMLSEDKTVLYVGKAKNLKNRVTSYTQAARLPVRLQRMVAQIRDVEIVITKTESEALLLEANLIQKFMPPFNVLLRDDKSFPYILITGDHDFPQLTKHRGAKKRKGSYFGPFASGAAVTETLNVLARGFQLRTCSDSFFSNRKRPCLQYHIKRCTAPCVNRVSHKNYARQVEQACAFLRGQTQDVQKKMAAQMQEASDALDFERAAFLRDRIQMLTAIQSKQDIHLAGLGSADVFALYQKGGRSAIQLFFYRGDRNLGTHVTFPKHDSAMESSEVLGSFLSQFYAKNDPAPQIIVSETPSDKEMLEAALSEKMGRKVQIIVPQRTSKKRLIEDALANAATALARKMAAKSEQKKHLKELATLFDLPRPPKRIEVYDNSHIQGAFPVGAMIAAGEEGFLKKTYRKFNIKKAKGGDDFGMMQEVLDRRFKRLLTEDPKRTSDMWPDLLLIDGGAGQVGKVRAALAELGVEGVAVVGIAKGPDRNAGREHFYVEGKKPFMLPKEDAVLYYLQRLRDEAHRFAIGTHRARRTKAISVSGLEDIPGIGAKRKKALLHVFGSGKAVSGAREEDLARVEGISPALAKKIYDTFHE